MKTITSVTLLAGSLFLSATLHAAPLKVYLMAGQSNMQGFSKITTFPHIGMDPETAPILKKMVNADGTPRVYKDVWISTSGVTKDAEPGQLTAGYGGGRGGGRIGPELTFGIYMQEHVKQPILIIKTAWGGKSLCRDFRPPSAGPWDFGRGAADNEKDPEATRKARREISGVYYRKMVDYVQKVLGDIKRVYPDHDPSQGYEIAASCGFKESTTTAMRRPTPNWALPDVMTNTAGCLHVLSGIFARASRRPKCPSSSEFSASGATCVTWTKR